MKAFPSNASCAGVVTTLMSLLMCVALLRCVSGDEVQVGVQTVMVPMRDGTRLATDIYFPEAKGIEARLPAVLLRHAVRQVASRYCRVGAVLCSTWFSFRGAGLAGKIRFRRRIRPSARRS